MGSIPAFLLIHSITIEPRIGSYSHGPQYGPAVTYECFVEDGTTLQRDREGQEVVSTSRVFLALEADCPVESRVTVNGRETTVLDVKRRDGGSLPVPSHLELILR
jgi:hypothetical protein